MLIRHLAPILALTVLVTPRSFVGASAPASIPATDQTIAHALNRLAFGARPDEAAQVKRDGLDRWIEGQLNPSRIDDGGMSNRLAHLSTLDLDSETLARDIFQPARRERQKLQRERSQGDPGLPPLVNQSAQGIIRRDRQIVADLSEAKILRAVYSERQLEEVLVDFWFNHFNVFAGKGPTRVWIGDFEGEAIRPHVLGNFRTMLGAVARSPAMLFYLDNWMNVDARQTAHGNQQPTDGDRQAGPGRSPASGSLRTRRATGLNENYARELMELHTLGVDGGYTEADVVNVARAFTGWGIDRAINRQPSPGNRNPVVNGRSSSGFRFDPRSHDTGEKKVLGHTIKAGGGISDGERVLDILASDPSTARFIARKLAVRFVSDAPAAALVDRAAARFSATHGDLRETLRVIITSPEFFAPDVFRAKVKTPFEFVVSSLRATGADMTTALPVVRELRGLGMPPYLCQPPTGYDDTAATWVSPGALVARMNFAVALASGRFGTATAPLDAVTIGSAGFQRK
jgi:uncharacterized protein (DUF1800 family)